MAAKRTPTSRKRKRCDSFIMSLAVFPNLQKKLNRSPDTVSRYVHEYEAAVNAVCVVIDAQNT